MLIKRFEQIHKEKKESLILISHQERIIQMADRIMVISDGKAESIGEAKEIMPTLFGQELDSCECRRQKEVNSMESNKKIDLDKVTRDVLKMIDSYGFKQEGAYNLRLNGMAVCHGDSRHINIVKKEDKPGIDIHISGEAKNEQVHIPVVMSKEGVDIVYNDFYIEDGADVTIIAGCGIHGEGCSETRHDGIHAFHVGKGCNVKYVENHYAEGNGTGQKVLNPVTKIYVGEDSVFTLETTQIRGVDSTERENYIELADNAKLFVTEKLMTDEGQTAVSNMDVELNGENSSARIVSRSVGKGTSKQVFHPRAIGNNQCHAHIQCDSIIMDKAEISSIPEIDARHVDAQIIHEAAIGRINDEQLVKLRTFGMSEEEAEAVIIESFLK